MISTSSGILQTGSRVVLRHPLLDDTQELLALVRASRRLHRPWSYPPSNAAAFGSWVASASSARTFGGLVCLRETGEIVGAVNLNEIVRGVFLSAYLSYYGSAAHAGQGLMREGVALLLRHAFRELGLHRLEANVQPGNERSLALVRALGFSKEGFSPRYLKIGGRWRDHERWALLAEDWRAARRWV